jgi:hypothetical protein
MNTDDNMTKALKGLAELVNKGWDYCDAEDAMVKEYGVDQQELERLWFND